MKTRLVTLFRFRLAIIGVLSLAIAAGSTYRFGKTNSAAEVPTLSSLQQLNACNCEDIPDLESRLAEVNAARAALINRSQNLNAHEQGLGQIVPYSQDVYNDAVERFVQQAIDAAHISGARQAKGLLGFTQDCSSTLKTNELTGCLWQSLEINEAVRQKFCEQRTAGGDYPISVYLKKEQDAYWAEREFIRGQLERLSTTCKIGNWTGRITVYWKQETAINITLPRPGEDPKSAPHGTDITKDVEVHEADIYVVDGQGVAISTMDWDRTETVDKSGPTACHGSMGKPKMSTISYHSSSVMAAHGSVSHPTSIHVSFDRTKGTYSLSVSLPEIYGNGYQSFNASESGECAGKPAHNLYDISRKPFNGPSATGNGNGKADALVLDGSDSPQPMTFTLGNTTTTTGYTIEWHLKRSRAR